MRGGYEDREHNTVSFKASSHLVTEHYIVCVCVCVCIHICIYYVCVCNCTQTICLFIQADPAAFINVFMCRFSDLLTSPEDCNQNVIKLQLISMQVLLLFKYQNVLKV